MCTTFNAGPREANQMNEMENHPAGAFHTIKSRRLSSSSSLTLCLLLSVGIKASFVKLQ